jgi:hypothetical protein
MLDLIARFSPRLRAVLALPKEVADVFTAVEDLLHDRTGNPKVQGVLNKMRDIRKKLATIRGD